MKIQLIQYNLNRKGPCLKFYDDDADIIIVHTQENSRSIPASYFVKQKTNFTRLQQEQLSSTHNLFCVYDHNAMQQLIFIHKQFKEQIKLCYKKVLNFGAFGQNKAAMFILLQISSKYFMFVNLHLESKKQTRRVQQFNLTQEKIMQILQKLKINQCNISIFGDYNTKITADLAITEGILKNCGFYFSKDNQIPICCTYNATPISRMYQELNSYDEFNEILRDCQFNLTEPAKPSFQPTYKINTELPFYQKRTPSWTDRVLINFGYDYKYYSLFTRDSDHFPVILSLKYDFNTAFNGNIVMQQQEGMVIQSPSVFIEPKASQYIK